MTSIYFGVTVKRVFIQTQKQQRMILKHVYHMGLKKRDKISFSVCGFGGITAFAIMNRNLEKLSKVLYLL